MDTTLISRSNSPVDSIKKIPQLLAVAVTSAILNAPLTSAADLSVKITALRNNNGDVHIAVYDTPSKFPKNDGMLKKTETMIYGQRSQHMFKGLKAGFYAVAVYHDENNNDEFDTNLIGLPIEGFAFSNKAFVFLGPPTFSAAQISLPEKGAQIEIKMGYSLWKGGKDN